MQAQVARRPLPVNNAVVEPHKVQYCNSVWFVRLRLCVRLHACLERCTVDIVENMSGLRILQRVARSAIRHLLGLKGIIGSLVVLHC